MCNNLCYQAIKIYPHKLEGEKIKQIPTEHMTFMC